MQAMSRRFPMQVDSPFRMEQSDLFECEVHLDELSDIMCIAAAGMQMYVHVLGLRIYK